MRDYRIDNAKGVLILLVVLGHFLESVQGWSDSLLRGPLTLIYMFHMPAFVFLAGITAKTDSLGRRIANLAVILVLFQVAYMAPTTLIKGFYPDSPLQPHWILWFLLSMVWWLAALPFIRKIPAPLLVSVAAAVLVGALPFAGYALSSSRTLVFLPFFVAGHLYGRQILGALPRWRSAPVVGVVALAVIGVGLYAVNLDDAWVHGARRFNEMGAGLLDGGVTRLALTLVAAASSFAFLMTVSARNGLMARVGVVSLSVFLLHGFAVKVGGKAMRAVYEHFGAVPALALALALTALTVAVLARPFLDQAIRTVSASIVDYVSAAFSRQRAA